MPPPHGYEFRNEAFQQIKDEILAELSLHPDNPNYRQAVEADPWNEQAAAMVAERIWDGCGGPDEARAIINKAIQNNLSSLRLLQTAIYFKKLSGGPS